MRLGAAWVSCPCAEWKGDAVSRSTGFVGLADKKNSPSVKRRTHNCQVQKDRVYGCKRHAGKLLMKESRRSTRINKNGAMEWESLEV